MEFTPKNRFFTFIRGLQKDICKAIEVFEPEAKFIEDQWERAAGGGGWTATKASTAAGGGDWTATKACTAAGGSD